MFEDLIPAGAGQQQRASADVFDDLVPSSGSKILQAAQGDGGFVASAKQSVGALVKGAGQFAGDFVPGVGQDNPVKRYGQEVIDSNPLAVHTLDDIAAMPGTALKEATGNAAGSYAGMVGARLIGQGVTAAAPLAGPAAPLVAGAGQAISWAGPYVVAALPSFGGIREQQIQDNPEMADSTTGKAVAALGAGAVGAIENRFGPNEWVLSALTKTGRDKLVEKFAAISLAGSIGKGMLHGAAVEGGEELVQNPIEQLAGFQDPTTPENVKDTVFSGAMGSLGGGMFGGPIAGLSHQAPAPVSVLRADGQGATTIDPATGPLSAAAAEHIQSQQPASMPPSAPVEEADAVPVTPQASSDLFADLVPEEDENDRLGRENLAAWGERANVLPLEHAQTIAASRPDLMVVEHPAGGGHTVVPRDWLSASQQQAAEALQAPVPAVDPLVEQVAALPVAEQRALAKRLGTKGLVTNKNAQEKIFAHPPEAIAKALAGESPIQSIDQAAHQANTEPSEAQKAAGNYAKGHIKVGGLDIAVENPIGSTRSGTGPDGKAWSVTMSDHYGYVKRTEGADGDQVDVYVKGGTAENHTGPVFVVDQFDPATGKFDEHKAMIGYKLKGAAIKAYDVHFADGSGPKRRQTVTKMSAEQFKDWVRNGDTKLPASIPAQPVPTEPAKVADGVVKPDAISGDTVIEGENEIPKATRKTVPRKGKGAQGRSAASSRATKVLAVRQAPDLPGIYHVSTQLVTVGERHLPVSKVASWEGAAKVFAGLSRFAVEHLDVLVTDKAGKPLAIIGGFKGAPTQASVYPSTVLMELARIKGAAHVWMAHNHPSGTPDLSNADRMLSSSFESTLRGSNVEYHGLAALARTGDTISWMNDKYDNGTVSVDQPTAFKVPMVEREITESNPGAAISSPSAAKGLVSTIAKDQPGIVFLTAQNAVSAFVPFDPQEMGELRSGDRLMRLFRAASKAGGAAAFVAMPDGKVTGQQFSNVKGALGTIDVKVLDGIRYQNEGAAPAESLAEKGLDASNGHDFFNKAGESDQIGRLDQLVYGLAAEGKSSNEILQAIVKTSAVPFNRQLARLLIAKGVSAKVTVGDAKGWAIHAGPSNNYAAAYNPKTNTASLFRPASAERHLLHEMVHAATLDALGQKSLASGQLKALFHHVQTKLGKRSHYGLTNAEEFLAEAFTNRKFQQVLSRMAAPDSSSSGLTSAWHWFLRIVRGILGMDAQSESALSRALELGVDLMAPAVKSADVLSRFNSERLAPNGKPSKLDDEQYQQVRTPQFKAWFGDWETAALRDFLNGSPLADLQTSEAPHRGYAALREWAVGIFRDYGFKAVHPVIGEVQMDERAVRDSMGHRISPAKAVAFKAVPDVIENGRIVHVATRGLMDSIYISAPVRINDVDDVVTVLVHRDPNTQRFYLHSVSTKDNLLKPKQSGAPVSDRQSTPGAVPSGDVHNILHQALTFKGATSKVIDENGEPLVVFHGTRDGGTFTEFQPNERGLIFAASTRETAASYAGRDTDVDLNNATKQRGVIPLFLNIRSPLEKDFGGANYNTLASEGMDAQTDILGKQARKAGNDGAILRNLIDDGGDLPDMTDVETPADIFIAFDPKQLKSATQNAGSFDATYPDLRFNVVDDADRLTVKDWLGHQLANQRSWALGALTRDQLADIYGERMPEVAQFDRVVQEMDQARNVIAEQADAIIERWRKLKGPEADQLADLMHQATLAQFDPDLVIAAESPEQAELLANWETLSPEAQQLYRDVRDQYAATLAKLRNGLSKRAERAGTNGQRIAAEIRLQFDKYLAEGPYFPLARFGDFVLIADKGAERIVEAFESSAAREKRARQLRVSGWTTKLTAKKAYSATKDGPAGEFVGDVLKLVDGLEMDAKEKGALMDSLNQLAISSLPDQSYRRHFTHRKGTPGYSQDAMRAFAASMQHVGHHVARVLHGDELTLLLDSLNKQISETTGDVDTTVQQQVANELAKRLDLMMNPTTHPVTAALGQVGFVMSLGGSVASGITNLSQMPLITFPWLGAKFGFDKAAGALTKASKDYFGGRWDKWSGFVLKDNKALTGDEKRALQQLEDAGLVTLTQTSDLASTATTDSASSSRSWAINRAMKIIGWTFSVPEVFNRQVSALAAYRLAVEKGQTHDEAVETALETLRRTHFDYSASNRSRWMAGNFTRVVTMFKQYSQQMTYLLWRNAHQALKGESPEVRREARRMLLGVAAMHFSAAGALGLPLGVFGITPLLGLLSMGMGDGDDPWDWQTEFRNMLADVFGKAGGEAIAHGPLRTLLNVDFASRVGLGDLWVRSPQGEQEGRDLVEAWMLTLLGPVAGYAANIGTAVGAFNEGKTGRGLEAMLPKMLAAPLKATRYETEGVKSWRGDDMGVALDTGDILGTALGFNPTKVAEMNEGRAAIKGRETKLTGRREGIVNQWMAATIAGDQAMQAEAMQMAMRFNLANPGLAIRADSLQHSLQTKLRNQAMIKDGVYLQKRRQDLRAEGRFSNVE
ncbi:PLxRFG domain-containing protein [Quatrionicoccus australiensis]|uniref:PLxRFG domain-containing protein n=1 Tax=Quatrionicoccus australiensis TaxID=138118 RepID=UPI001CF8BE5D|nr:PLxRFG domain-containing protein [Quatrionicoccus australiensis]UCV14116.1 PLxRFG domain-containing protein [Quatrionicoccus australiensis]